MRGFTADAYISPTHQQNSWEELDGQKMKPQKSRRVEDGSISSALFGILQTGSELCPPRCLMLILLHNPWRFFHERLKFLEKLRPCSLSSNPELSATWMYQSSGFSSKKLNNFPNTWRGLCKPLVLWPH
ncbi:MAG: hypothetical protein LUQ22_04050 [Methanotrichaceae archaeon]|nr:hypothetical protein [Methanotrichaceae archaeon]